MKDFQNLTLRCIKGQPINDVVCRRLTDMGFPVDAPRQSDKISAKFDSYFWKLNDSEYSICGRVETEYLSRLFEYKDREKSFSEVLDLLSEYGITEDELAAGLSSGCVYNLSFSEAETLYDEFVFLIQQLLCRANNVSYLQLDVRELEDGLYIGSLVRDIIKTPAYSKLHREERRDYFAYGRAIHDAMGNWDVVSESTICGCFECGHILAPSLIVEYDEYDYAAICPYCGATAILTDKQGYTITEDYLKALKQYLLVNELQEVEEDDDE